VDVLVERIGLADIPLQPVAKLVGQQRPVRKPRQPGSAKGKLTILAEDDEHLENFEEYMS
jgi:antitoxin (DNA-binding transcriptional repressor) of toxin-antitoxin stability system